MPGQGVRLPPVHAVREVHSTIAPPIHSLSTLTPPLQVPGVPRHVPGGHGREEDQEGGYPGPAPGRGGGDAAVHILGQHAQPQQVSRQSGDKT